MNDTILSTNVKEKNLRVTISADMTVSEHFRDNKEKHIVLEKGLSIPLHKAVVRPHLEY